MIFKIQGRFDTRLNLSSSSVDEVIQKRLLEKRKMRPIYYRWNMKKKLLD